MRAVRYSRLLDLTKKSNYLNQTKPNEVRVTEWFTTAWILISLQGLLEFVIGKAERGWGDASDCLRFGRWEMEGFLGGSDAILVCRLLGRVR